ncbi:MAG: NUDIX domain-containing protein [Candidatus Spechtbacteria bacterium]|nr:NUDIX domain-containing protein [Candidatus Spechtbacteria bacterium]
MKRAPNGTKPKEGPFRIDIINIANYVSLSTTMESFEDCAARETREECGIEIDNIHFQHLSNLTKYAPKHYVHIAMVAKWKSGEVELLEPEKCESWAWYDLDNIPEPLFETCRVSLEIHRTQSAFSSPQ